MSGVRYGMLQVRDDHDPMAQHEIECFVRGLACAPEDIRVFDLLKLDFEVEDLKRCDAILVGGSGDYSVVVGGEWLGPALDIVAEAAGWNKPLFGSCWGFQALAAALGGQVKRDANLAEIGSIEILLTDEGRQDPLFGSLGPSFSACIGHEDSVIDLPPGAVRLGRSSRVLNQALRLGSYVYGTQFHPELGREDLLLRLRRYPRYLEEITGQPFAEFAAELQETPQSNQLLRRFVSHFFG